MSERIDKDDIQQKPEAQPELDVEDLAQLSGGTNKIRFQQEGSHAQTNDRRFFKSRSGHFLTFDDGDARREE